MTDEQQPAEEKIVHGVNCACMHPESDLPASFPLLGQMLQDGHVALDIVGEWMRYFSAKHDQTSLTMIGNAFVNIEQGLAQLHLGVGMLHMLHAGVEPGEAIQNQMEKPTQPPRAN